MSHIISTFHSSTSNHEEIYAHTWRFLCQFHKARKHAVIESINCSQLSIFNKSCTKRSVKTAFCFAILSPTADAVRKHSCRAYMTIQRWCSNDLDPTKWGWMKAENDESYIPIEMTIPPAPPELLENIFCHCKGGCLNVCSYRSSLHK